MLSVLPRELVSLILDFTVREDLDAVLVFQSCKTLRDIIAEKQRAKQFYPRRLFYTLRPVRLEITRPMLEWFTRQGRDVKSIAENIGRSGKREVIEWILSQRPELNSRVLNGLAGSGNLELLKELNKKTRYSLSKDGFIEAAGRGDLAICKWIKEETIDLNLKEIFQGVDAAAKGGHRKVLDWLRAERTITGNLTLASAAKGGHLDLMKWLLARRFTLTTNVHLMACNGGKLEAVKWLEEHGCPISPASLVAAVRSNNLELVEWLLLRKWDARRYMTVDACKDASLPIIRLLHNAGQLDKKQACASAAAEGRIELLAEFRMRDYPFDPRAVAESAIVRGHYEVLNWIADSGFTVSREPRVCIGLEFCKFCDERTLEQRAVLHT